MSRWAHLIEGIGYQPTMEQASTLIYAVADGLGWGDPTFANVSPRGYYHVGWQQGGHTVRELYIELARDGYILHIPNNERINVRRAAQALSKLGYRIRPSLGGGGPRLYDYYIISKA